MCCMIKRFDRLEIVTSDLAGTAAIYRKNFGFTVRPGGPPDEACIVLGDAEIRLRSGAEPAKPLSSNEGLAAIWLEADDVYQAAEALQRAGIVVTPVRVEGGRRILAVKPESANMVPLFLFDRL
jgi:predicted enzyme related to lactoylglutathione lyase